MDRGAHYRRSDFQVHTPRDANWTGTTHVTDADRALYAARLIQACREKGLQAIAITDHHDMAFAEYVRRAAREETAPDGKLLPKERQIIVFPGMELTLSVPCQALLIFDADFPSDMFALAMTALALTPNPPDAPKTAATSRLTHIQSLGDLKRELDKHTYLRDRYIVFPHVGENGQFSLLRKGQAAKYTEMSCVGGYVDGEVTKLGQGNRNIVDGKVKEWGNKRIALFQTSDNRFEDHRDLGRASTWVKWATPTAEALRQACLAQESRVSQETPLLPAVVIVSISVSNSVFLGPIELEFNPQYSALIGGRGTGKSTILEYLRWALCDQPPGSSDEDTPNYQARRGRLIEQTLKPVNGVVQVRYEVNGVVHVVRRNSQDGSLQIKIADDDMRVCREDEVRTLLPIQAYSQKQLSDVSVRVEELSRFITAPIRTELARIDQQLSDRANRIRAHYATIGRQRGLAQTLQKRELEERSLAEQAEAIRISLTGLSEEDRLLLEKGKVFDGANLAVQSWQDGASSFVRSAEQFLTVVGSALAGDSASPPDEPEAAMLAAAHGEYRSLLSDAKEALDALIGRARKIADASTSTEAESPWRQWAEKLATFRAAYEAAVQRSSSHSEKMRQLKEIEEQLNKQSRETARVREELRALASADAEYRTERAAWLTALKARDELFDSQCRQLTDSSGGTIRAFVRRYADASEFVSSLRQFLSGSRVQGNKIEALGEAIMAAADADEFWNSVLADIEKLAEFDSERDSTERRPDTPILSACGFAAGDLDRIGRSLKSEAWLTLSLQPIPSAPVFEFRARENEYIPFRNASAGQQATALLRTLLNQVGPPLIIDQPEEDLDNPVMSEVVEQVWEAKRKRQLIFTSHNANLVVNGDAELVVWCDHRTAGDQSGGMIAGEGAIDIPDIREAIKRVMEGGEAAFNLRKEKYGF